ncbi:hypothetical protein ANDSL2ph1_CDS0023 [Acetoanaerobium phage ANDSL2_ph1]
MSLSQLIYNIFQNNKPLQMQGFKFTILYLL